jgi:DNA polymerase
VLIVDFETRSPCPLGDAGAYLYAEDPETEILCIGYHMPHPVLEDTFIEGTVDEFYDLPEQVLYYLRHTEGLVCAWNAQFDRLIWQRFAPVDLQLPLKRWYCAAAAARVNALPSSLNKCARAVYGKYKKDVRGAQLIKAMSIPPYEDTPALRKAMKEYCLQDVRLTYDLMQEMRYMSPKEHRDWIANEQVNDDGIQMDLYMAGMAIQYAQDEKDALAERIYDLTDGEIVRHSQITRVKKWVGARLGEEIASFDKNARQQLLARQDLPPDVREIVEIVDDGNRSSVSKFNGMINRSGVDDRIRGAFVYAGASQTLRFASRGLQLHNFARDCLTPAETEKLIDQMDAYEEIDNVMQTLSRALRPALVPSDGCKFVVGDWKGIEACALPWLAYDSAAGERLNVLADPTRDIYVETQKSLSLETRQLGKVVELSMGYGGGVGAFKAMAAAYGVTYPESKIKPYVVDGWRYANPWAETFWNALEKAAKAAVANPGKTFGAGRVQYTFMPTLLEGTLVCWLPDGTLIQYPKARLEDQESPYGTRTVVTAMKANWEPAAKQPDWPRVTLWRGLLAENVTQAFCAALLRDLIRRLQERGYPVVAHVHDEVVVEVPAKTAEEDVANVTALMEKRPVWAPGLPLIADVKSMERYGK